MYRVQLKLEIFKHLNMKCQELCISLIPKRYTLKILTMMDKDQVYIAPMLLFLKFHNGYNTTDRVLIILIVQTPYCILMLLDKQLTDVEEEQ